MEQRALLLVGDSQNNADMFHAIRFLFGDPVIYLRHGDQETLVCSNFERAEAAEHSRVRDVRSFEDFEYSQLVQAAPQRSQAFAALVQRVVRHYGLEALTVTDHIPLSVVDVLRADGLDVRCDPTALLAERSLKSAEDLKAMNTVQRVNEQAMQRAIEVIAGSDVDGDSLLYDGVPLTSEYLRSVVERTFLEAGCQAEATIIAGGNQAVSPHNQGSGVLRPNQAIVLDFFPRHSQLRFHADMTRTVSKGDPGPELRRMYEVTLRAQEAALEMIAPGINGRDVYETVCRVYEEAGYHTSLATGRYPAEGLVHSLGHGLGLQVHEEPSLSSRDQILQVGHVVTVEPGLYYPGIGAVRIEDVVVVTEQGCSTLTQFEKKFIV